VSINDQLALKLAYAVNYNSGVAEDVDEFDTQTSVTVVYGF
jgi:putative salt-induced outer membrane protein YdiY